MNKIPYSGKEARKSRVHVHKGNHRALGTVKNGRGRPKISIAFDRHLFDHIAIMASERGVSFATVVREIVAQAISDGRSQ